MRILERHSSLPLTATVPGVLTAIREQSRRAGRFAVEIAGAVIAPVSVEMISEFRLVIGATIDATQLNRVLAASRRVACYDRALDALARRSRSTRDLERWLAERGFTHAEIRPATERLTSLGLLDDLLFARGFAHARAVGRGFGARRVAAELARHGVASSASALVLAELSERRSESEEAALDRQARRRAKALATLEPFVARRRLVAWLIRRGFAPAEVAAAVRRVLA